jgi:hypothetical protein
MKRPDPRVNLSTKRARKRNSSTDAAHCAVTVADALIKTERHLLNAHVLTSQILSPLNSHDLTAAGGSPQRNNSNPDATQSAKRRRSESEIFGRA